MKATSSKFQTAYSNSRSDRLLLCATTSGFTLLELIVVIFIVSLMLAVSVPSFTGIFDSRITSDAKRLASILRYLNDSAISTKDAFNLKININNKLLNYKVSDEEKTERIDSISGIELQSKGLVSEGEIIIFFGTAGAAENFNILLKKDKSSVTVSLNALSGRIKIMQTERE